MKEFIKKIDRYIREQQMIDINDRIVIGVSGGADSMCLLNVLIALREEYECSLYVVHVNHCLRGEEANQEEQYVCDFCRDHGIPIRVYRYHVMEYAKENNLSVEEAGRLLRYQAFDLECKEREAHKIAIAHNQNDNAETIMFHLFRGSWADGMSGIAPKRQKVIRPLLNTTREEIEKWMKEQSIPFCTDSSNLSLDYTRNIIRHSVLPIAIKQINEKSIEHISNFAQQMRQIADFLHKICEQEYDRLRVKTKGGVELPIEVMSKLEPIIAQGIIMMAIEEVSQSKKDIDQVHITNVLALMTKQTGKQIHLPYHIIARRGYTTISMERIIKNAAKIKHYHKVTIPGEIILTNPDIQFEFELLTMKKYDDIPKNNYTKWFDYDKIKDAVVIRTRQRGDFLQIHKDGGNKSLKSLLIDSKVPQKNRDNMIVLASGNHIMWVPGVRTSEAFLVDQNTTRIMSVNIRWKEEVLYDGGKH